jgi:hypothetical protein
MREQRPDQHRQRIAAVRGHRLMTLFDFRQCCSPETVT